MADMSLIVHKALFAAVKDATPCDVWDGVPQDTPFPYVTFDYEDIDNRDFVNRRRDQHFYYLTIWSQRYGQAQIKEIMAAIAEAVHERPLALDSGSAPMVRVIRRHTIREPDNRTFQGRMTIQILSQPE